MPPAHGGGDGSGAGGDHTGDGQRADRVHRLVEQDRPRGGRYCRRQAHQHGEGAARQPAEADRLQGVGQQRGQHGDGGAGGQDDRGEQRGAGGGQGEGRDGDGAHGHRQGQAIESGQGGGRALGGEDVAGPQPTGAQG